MEYIKVVRSHIKKSPIILAGEKNSLMNEISLQLSTYSHLKIDNFTGLVKTNISPIGASAIFFSVGFDQPSYAQTLLGTVTLLEYLQMSLAANCTLFLLLGSKTPHLTKTSSTMARQFSSVYKTKLDIIQCFETDPDEQTAEAVVKKIIINHKNRSHPSLARIIPKHLSSNADKVKSGGTIKRILIITLIFLGLVLAVSLLWFGIFFVHRDMLVDNFLNGRHLQSQKNLSVVSALTRFNPFESLVNSKIFLNSENLSGLVAVNTGILNNQLQSASGRSTVISAISFLENSLRSNIQFGNSNNAKIKIQNHLGKLRSNLERASFSSSFFSPSEPKNLLITFHDSDSVSPYGGKISGLSVVNFDSKGLNTFSYYLPSQIESLVPGQLRSYPDFEKITGQSHMRMIDLEFEPDATIFANTVIQFVEKSLNQKIDLWLPVTTEVFTKTFCSHLVTLKAACDSPMSLNLSSVFSSSETIVGSLNNLPVSQKNELFIKVLELLSNRDTFVHSQLSPSVLNQLGWGSGDIPDGCPDSLACTHLTIHPAFYSFSPGSFVNPVKSRIYVTVRPETSDTMTRYVVEIPPFTQKNSKLIFWFLVSGDISLLDTRLDNVPIDPAIKYVDSSLGKTRLGFYLDTKPLPGQLSIDFSKPLIHPGRFQYQLTVSPFGQKTDTDVVFNYPPQWSAISHRPPIVATAGKLGYNTTDSLINLHIDLIPK